MDSTRKISFFYPAVKIGGAQLLFSRLAESLYNCGFLIKVYEFDQCYISSFLNSRNILFERITINSKSGKYIVPDHEIFILSLSFSSNIYNYFEFKQFTRFIFWDLHPNCLTDQFAFSGLYKKMGNSKLTSILINILDYTRRRKIISLIKLGEETNSIFFMCLSNLLYNQKLLGFSEKVRYLPIPIPLKKEEYISRNNNLEELSNFNENTHKIRIGWISRLDFDKVAVLKLLIIDIADLYESNSIEIIIIGAGPAEDELRNFVLNKNLNFVSFAGKIDTDLLSIFLKENVDIGFSMGTSALEFALNVIPTVLVPSVTNLNYFESTNNRYLWLYKSIGYNLSNFRNNQIEYQSFRSIIEDFLNSETNLGKLSHKYVVENHSLEYVTIRLNEIIEIGNLTFKDIQYIKIDRFTIIERMLFLFKDIYKMVLKR